MAGVELRRGNAVTRAHPRHWHEEFHLCVIQAGAGELHHGGSAHYTPAGSLFIVPPGEVHSNRTTLAEGCAYRTLNVAPALFSRAAGGIAERPSAPPSFPVRITFEANIIARYLRCYAALETSASNLERESLLVNLLAQFVLRYAADPPPLKRVGRERAAVQRARDYLTDNLAANVSLEELAQVAGLSPFHLNRVFRAEFGLPPHAFQTQARLVRAKRLLALNVPISQASVETGFADQSHFTRHFKRLTGFTPGQYQQNSKNVQDVSPALRLS